MWKVGIVVRTKSTTPGHSYTFMDQQVIEILNPSDSKTVKDEGIGAVLKVLPEHQVKKLYELWERDYGDVYLDENTKIIDLSVELLQIKTTKQNMEYYAHEYWKHLDKDIKAEVILFPNDTVTESIQYEYGGRGREYYLADGENALGEYAIRTFENVYGQKHNNPTINKQLKIKTREYRRWDNGCGDRASFKPIKYTTKLRPKDTISFPNIIKNSKYYQSSED